LREARSGSGVLRWSRDCTEIEPSENVTKRKLFSICGKLVSLYPVGCRLRVAGGYIKRQINDCGWDGIIPDNGTKMLSDIMKNVNDNDPVNGQWLVRKPETCKVWCDASRIALGIVV